MNTENTNKRFRVLTVGVGGQGVLTVARIMGDAALSVGMETMIGQLHGMSQRGGSVSSTVVIGPGHSALIDKRQADVVLGFEPLEVLRALPMMSENTKIVFNNGRIIPFLLTYQEKSYPDMSSILAEIRAVTTKIHEIDGPQLIKKIGPARSLNFIMLGALSGLDVLPFDDKVLWKAVEKRLPPNLLEINRQAFILGLESTKKGKEKYERS